MSFKKIFFALALPLFILVPFFVAPQNAFATCITKYVVVGGFTFPVSVGDCSGTSTSKPTVTFSATPETVSTNGASSIFWKATNATSCTGTGFSTGGKTNGSVIVYLQNASKTFSISCSGSSGSVTDSVTVTVIPTQSSGTNTNPVTSAGATPGGGFYFGVPCGFFEPCNSPPFTPQTCKPALSSNKSSVVAGQSATLTWSATMTKPSSTYFGIMPTTISVSNVGEVASTPAGTITPDLSGTVSVSPTEPTTYITVCKMEDAFFGSTTNSSPVTITTLAPVGGSCSASPGSITSGQSSTWTATPSGGDGAYTYVWSGTDSLAGTSQSVIKTYTSVGTKSGSVAITSAGSSKTISCSNTVTVINPQPQCSDGIDNDGDGKIDSADFGCYSTGGGGGDVYDPNKNNEFPNPQCSDGIDNNGNGFVDYPNDLTCSSSSDNNEEVAPVAGITLSATQTLVQKNQSTTLTWSASNVKTDSCSLAGTNGDSWNLSGTAGSQVTGALVGETIYTLSCTDLNKKLVSTQVTVKVVPSFEEI